MASALDRRYAFLVEWHDALASLMRQYQLFFYDEDGSIEMYDIKNRRTFLKRCKYDRVKLEDLFIGATVTVYARQLHVIDYADEFTRQSVGAQIERTLAIIKPDAYISTGLILHEISRNDFVIGQMRMLKLTEAEASLFYGEHAAKPFFRDLVGFMTSDVIVAIELVGSNAIRRWRELIGPTNFDEARKKAPDSLRALYGHNSTANGLHGSDSPASAAREIEFFFSGRVPFATTAVFDNCTCCVVRPHAVLNGSLGAIVDAILQQGFEISAMQLFRLGTADAEEFLEVYKGVLPEYPGMVEQMTSGPCVALEVRAQDAVATFRDFVGPMDPAVAARVRPTSIRAVFGRNLIENAVHCTDLETDGEIEVAYFFKVLQQP
eukprot:Amastigsp_a2338_24.p1 type:complete len:378 gc:universal Amastigsp_a2338_24:1167-34(-)